MKLIAILILTLAGAFAAADESVWSQLQNGAANEIVGKVESLEISSSRVNLSVQVDGDRKSLLLCSNDEPDSARDVLNGQMVEMLREAYRNGESLRFSLRGPWNPCVQSVSLFDQKSRKSSPRL